MHHELHAKQPDIADEILASARANTRRDIALPLSWPQEPRQLIRFSCQCQPMRSRKFHQSRSVLLVPLCLDSAGIVFR
jgi:hypothetical protein